MSAPVVSVIVPAYNAAATLPRTLESVRRQTFADYEIIVIDDGSSDATMVEVAEIASIDPRVLVIRQSNAGVASARNSGIAQARGRFLAFLDADDTWDQNHLEIHVARFAQDPSLAVSFSATRYIDGADRFLGRTTTPQVAYTTAELLATSPCTTASAIVVRTEVVVMTGGFNDRMRLGAEDQEWLVRIRSRGFIVSGTSAAWVSYRADQEGLSSHLERMLEGYRQMLAIVWTYEPELVDRLGPLFEARMSRYLARCALERGRCAEMARAFLRRALMTCPGLLLDEPRHTFSVLAQSLFPVVGLAAATLRRRQCPGIPAASRLDL